jgi:hypothetical protein
MARFGFRLTIGFIALGVATPIAAGQIDFEDLPASNDSQQTLRGEYAHLGVMFVATDDGATWSGGAGGDPGRWGLEGSSGATFLGFDGRSYAIALSFDAPVRSFGLEVARAQGAVPFFLDQFRLTGFLEGRLVETRAVLLGGVNEWKEIALEAEVDRVVWFGTGLPGHRFGVDGLRWDGVEPEVLDIEIDILPGVGPVWCRSWCMARSTSRSRTSSSRAFGSGQAPRRRKPTAHTSPTGTAMELSTSWSTTGCARQRSTAMRSRPVSMA